MKKISFLITACALMVVVCLGAANATEQVTLRFSSPLSDKDMQGWLGTTKPWSDAVTKRTGGKLKVKAYLGGSLISGFGAQPKGVAGGMADMGIIIASYHPAEFPMSMMTGIMHPGIDVGGAQKTLIYRILFEEIPAFQEEFKKNNLKRLFILSGAAYHLYSSKPVKKLDGFKGLKIRSFGANMPRIIKAVGGVPVSLGFAEILDALHKKVIDGTLGNPINVRDLKLYEVAPHMTFLGDNGISGLLDSGVSVIINLDVWNKLSPELKRIMLEEGKRIEWEYANYAEKVGVPSAVEDLKDEGVEIYKISNEQKRKWGELCPDFLTEVAAKLDAKGLSGSQAAKRYRELYAMSPEELKALWGKTWDEEIASIQP